MARENIILSSATKYSIDSLVALLDSKLSGELVTRIDKTIASSNITLLVYEKYYMRVSSYVSLTILIVENETVQTIELIGSGGGNGVFGIDWGANEAFAESAKLILGEKGFA